MWSGGYVRVDRLIWVIDIGYVVITHVYQLKSKTEWQPENVCNQQSSCLHSVSHCLSHNISPNNFKHNQL